MNRKTITVAISLLLALTAFAQQSNVNLSYNPQKDTEGLIPFSANLNSPQVNDDHTVVFRLRAPKAESVALSGAMTTVLGVRGNIPFTKGEDGIWTLTIGPLPVDMYQYNLVVDGLQRPQQAGDGLHRRIDIRVVLLDLLRAVRIGLGRGLAEGGRVDVVERLQARQHLGHVAVVHQVVGAYA